jgi:hypothetical protein
MGWIESHGFETLVAFAMFSTVTSVMPPLPLNQGWWITWLYNVVQIFGANAGKLAQQNSDMQAVTKFRLTSMTEGTSKSAPSVTGPNT